MTLTVRQRVAASQARVVSFFSDTKNLLRLSPPYPALTIDAPSTAVVPGAEYVLRFDFGVGAVQWRSRIAAVDPGRAFTDTSSGPFTGPWTHTHSFIQDGEGTLVEDRITCMPPLWAVPIVWVGLRLLFFYRRCALRRVFA